jgi:hypothetical protein
MATYLRGCNACQCELFVKILRKHHCCVNKCSVHEFMSIKGRL